MNLKYRPEIDGLRAVAVLPVILFHAGFTTFSGGFVGVDVFFVISGYLITSIIVKDVAAGTFSFWDFYERRARRILPALFLVILCCIPLAWMWMFPMELKAFATSVVSVCLFASNFLFWRQSGYFDPAAELKPLLHTWSLAVEEQYYIICPVAILLLWRLGRRNVIWSITLISVLSLALSEYASRYYPSANFYMLPTRAWELMAGALCSFAVIRPSVLRNNILSLVGIAAIVVSVFVYHETIPFPSLYALLPVMGTCAVILFAQEGTIVRAALSLKPFVGIGLISYSAYLWHQPLFAFARIRSLTEPTWQLMLGLAAASLILAYLSWRIVEVPTRKRGAWPLPNRSMVFSTLGVVVAAFITAGLAGHFTRGFPKRISPEVLSLFETGRETNPRSECIDIRSDTFCTYGKDTAVHIALLGDSHAHALAYELGKSFETLGLGMVEITRSGCPPVGSYKRTNKGINDCGAFHKKAMEFIKLNPTIDTVVLFSRWSLFIELDRYDNGEGGREVGTRVTAVVDGYGDIDEPATLKTAIAGQYQKSIRELLQLGKRVVIVYPQPEVGWDVPSFIAKSLQFDEPIIRPLSTSYTRFKSRSLDAYRALDGVGNERSLIRVIPERIFCNTITSDRCAAESGEGVFYFDDDHVNNLGASLISREIIGAMQKEGWFDKSESDNLN